jgi:hypothetical protein
MARCSALCICSCINLPTLAYVNRRKALVATPFCEENGQTTGFFLGGGGMQRTCLQTYVWVSETGIFLLILEYSGQTSTFFKCF